jgi:carboxyl-terminal processing protease
VAGHVRDESSTFALVDAHHSGVTVHSHLRGGSPTRPSDPTPTPTSDLPRAHLEQLIGVMQEHSINRLTIDWTMFRASVFGQASAAQTIADTYPAIRVALGLLGDGHSSYRSAANSIQRAIMSADRDDLIGWMVDVRGNGGGNMWPMVAGVGPVLGEGVIGYFIGPTGAAIHWEYRDGASWVNGLVQQRVDGPYRLRRDRPRVAVLTDNGIASSGEATVIAFRGRPDTRSFGDATCGLSTSNSSFTLSDGALLNLTTMVMADRTRTKYGDSIPPDEIVRDPDQAVQRALAWLQSGN